MALYGAGTAFLQVVPSMRGFHNTVRSELRTMSLEATVQLKPAVSKAEMAAAQQALQFRDQTVNVHVNTDKKSLADSTNAIALLARNLSSLAVPVGVGAAIPTIVAMGQAAATASQSFALLPAAGVAAALVMGTVTIATSGLGEAFKQVFSAKQDPKKLAEALAQLSPAARGFVLEVQSMKTELSGLKFDVQDAAFKGMAATVDLLGKLYLPVARVGFAGIATELNTGAQGIAAYLAQAQAVSTVALLFANVRDTMRELNPVGVAIVSMLLDIAAVGSEFLPGLAGGFAGAATEAANFVREARASGQLRQFISDGLSALGDLIATFMNLGAIVREVFRIANVDGGAFAGTLRDITGQMLAWVQSARGSEVIGQIFASLRDVASALAPLLGMVAAAVIDMVIKVGPALPPLAQGVGDVLNAARPMTALFTDLAVAVLPALGGALQFLAPVLGPLVALFVGASLASKAWAAAELIKNVILGASAAVTTGISIATGAYNLIAAVVRGNLNLWAIAQMALNAAMAANPIGIVVVVIAALVAAIILAWNHSETFRNIVMAAWEGIKSAASVAWSILQSIFAGLMTAVRAIGDFFATVFAAIGALWNWLYATVIAPTASAISTAISTVGDVINWLWSSVIQPTFNFIAEAAKILLAVILTIVFVPIYLYITYVLAPVFTWLWQNIIQPAWEGIQAAISAAWTFISGIFNAVVTYLTGVFTTTWNFYRDLVISVWNIIRDGINAVWVFIRDSIWNPIIAFLVGIFTATWNAYRDLVIAAWNLIRDGINAAWAFIRDNIWNPIINFLVATLGPAFNLARDVLVAAWNVIRDALNAVWVFIRDNIWNPLVNFVTVTIPNAFAAGRDAVGRLWDGIKKLVRDPIQAVVDVVYNNGIVKVWNWVADKVGLGADKRLDTWTVPQFAKGGPVERPTLGLIGEAGPEYVISAPAVRAAGGMSAVEELHQSLLNKSGRTAQRETLHYLNHGGIVEGADHNGPGTSSVGFGGVQRHVAQAGNYLKMKFGIGSVGGVGARPNASDHPAGLALDFMTSGDNGTQLANFLSSAANWSHFAIKYLIWRQRILNGPGTAWQGMEDRGSPTANHMDHVHVSFQGGPGSGTMDAGGAGGAGFVFDPIQFILDGIGIDLRSITSKLGNIGGGVWGEMMSGAGGKMATSAWDWAVKQVSDWWGRTGALVGAGVGGILGSGSPDVRKMVQSVALARGWGSGPEWDAADRLIAKESSWNPNAQNPTSTAFGLFQFLDSTWGSTGYKKSASPLIQAQAGFQYIGQRYGSPSKALAFHNANNWYDGGGVANGRGIMMKNVISPERVLSNRQTAAFEELVGFATGRSYGTRLAADRIGQGYGSGSGGDAPYIGTLVVPTPEGAGVDETLDGVFLRARHETKRGRYGRPGG